MLAEVYWNKEQDLINNGFDYVYEKGLLDNLSTMDVGKTRSYLNSVS
jgi:hypothetical protein